MGDSILNAALEYERRGFSVIPVHNLKNGICTCREGANCQSPGKHPKIQWRQYAKERPSKSRITSWFTKWPDAHLGIVTGRISGITVIDMDTDQAKQDFDACIPDSLEVPVVKTRRGHHYYFAYQAGHSSQNDWRAGTDVKSEGGFVVAPPTPNYTWLTGINGGFPYIPAGIELPSHTKSQKSHEVSNLQNGFLYREVSNTAFSASNLIPQGKRDDTLFHLAHKLYAGGMAASEIQYYLTLIANKCCEQGGLPDPKDKVLAAIRYAESRKRNIAQEVRDWVEVSNGLFEVSSCLRESQIVSKEDCHAAILEFRRLVKAGILENYRDKRGWYRKIETDLEIMDWRNANENPLDIKWPLGFEEYVHIYEKNIAIFAGEKDTGKTTLAMNFALKNCQKYKIRYLCSDMGASELRQRIKIFNLPDETWEPVEFINKKFSMQDAILANDVNIIDFLEVTDNFFEIAATILRIHEKLDKGIAVIFIQKDPKKDLGRGDTFSMEKARLYVTLNGAYPGFEAKIKTGKNRAQSSVNPRGLTRHYYLPTGADIECKEDWRDEKAG